MQSRVLKKLLQSDGYNVADYGDYIGVGNGYIHDLLHLDKQTLEITCALEPRLGRAGLKNLDLIFAYDKLEALVASGMIRAIIEQDDVVENPIPVYSVVDGVVVEDFTDQIGYPYTTLRGVQMFNNTHFATREQAIRCAIKGYGNAVESCADTLLDLSQRLRELAGRQAQYISWINELKKSLHHGTE